MATYGGAPGDAFDLPREHPFPAWHAVLLLPYVVLASALGLARVAFMADGGAIARIWGASLAADLAFVLGMLATGAIAYALALRQHTLVAVLVGFALAWLVDAVSFDLLLGATAPAWPQLFQTVASLGIAGLVFSALAPPLVARSAGATA